MDCPSCKSENTQRLEVVFEHGTNNIETTTRGSVRGFGDILPTASTKSTTTGTSMSSAARKAAPPRKKGLRNLIIAIVVGLFILGYGFTPSTWLYAVIGVAVVGVAGFLLKTTLDFNSKTWPELYARWQKSWMCNKCGSIYVQE